MRIERIHSNRNRPHEKAIHGNQVTGHLLKREFQRWVKKLFQGAETFSHNALSDHCIHVNEAMSVNVCSDVPQARVSQWACKAVPGCNDGEEFYCRKGCSHPDGNRSKETLEHVWVHCEAAHGMRFFVTIKM